MGPAMRAVLASCCGYCAGEGKVATHVSKMFAGRIFKDTAKVADCPQCGGSGLDPSTPRVSA